MSDHPMKDPVKGSPYEKMKKRPEDDEKIKRHFRRVQLVRQRIQDETTDPLRRLAKNLVEFHRDNTRR